jgi:hypothetical protein
MTVDNITFGGIISGTSIDGNNMTSIYNIPLGSGLVISKLTYEHGSVFTITTTTTVSTEVSTTFVS